MNIIEEVDILNQYIEFLHDMKFKYIDTNHPMQLVDLCSSTLSFAWSTSNEGYKYWGEQIDKIRAYINSNYFYLSQFIKIN